MNAITGTISAEALPGHNLTVAQNGLVITTEWGGQPTIPVNLPDGFTCTIVNYSNSLYTSNVLAKPMFILSGMSTNHPVPSLNLKPGQSCVLTAASVLSSQGGTTVQYFIGKASA